MAERKGTGLGLSMVYGFARQSFGTAAIRSEPARGTAVTIYLPRSLAALGAQRGSIHASLTSRGAERVAGRPLWAFLTLAQRPASLRHSRILGIVARRVALRRD